LPGRALALGAPGFFSEGADHAALLVTSVVLFVALALLGRMYMILRTSKQRAVEAEQILHTAIDSFSDGFAIYDADDSLIMCNDQLRQMYPAIAGQLVPGARCADLARKLCENRSHGRQRR